MEQPDTTFEIDKLGQARIPSPMRDVRHVKDCDRILYSSDFRDMQVCLAEGKEPPQMERAGAREQIYFDPSKLKAGIVTCGGLCPGLNDVIRALVMSLYHHYGVHNILGFPYGYEGLSYKYGHTPVELSPQGVSRIHELGGTILGSSRGEQNVADMVDTLERMNISLLFTLGGDGTLRGALAISEEIKRRGLKISVIGIPKTIDNDISYVQKSFGFETACAEGRRVISGANVEAMGARNGVGLVKLMGRDSGFIAAFSTLSNNDVNFCLVPEVPFSLEGLLRCLRERLERRGHAVIVVAEGAGQELMDPRKEKDASGNVRYGDIGMFLKERIVEHFKSKGLEINLKYIDPSYTIRSLPSNAHDAAFCVLLGHNAVHAGMSGRTGMLVGFWKGEFTHVPIARAVEQRKRIDSRDWLWSSVLSATGQPAVLI
jgi:6-phosphofructokinase 1